MKPFLDEDFLLNTDTAKELYHDVAEGLPIFDYHCHLPPQEIAENRRFDNIGQLMLGDDHYKWRAMAAFGIDDRYIHGSASDHDKFLAYARMLPRAIGNPLYHWTHLELRRGFGIEELLSEKTAEDIWERANALLGTEAFRARRLIEKFGVKLLCTTDDPIDDLKQHERIAADPSFSVKVLPAFRPDRALNLEKDGFADYIGGLLKLTGEEPRGVEAIARALEKRADYFHAHGCRLSDHGLNTVPFREPSRKAADRALRAALRKEPVDKKEAEQYRTYLLIRLGGIYRERDWAQQYHMNALRNVNRAGFEKHGPDTGYDAVSDRALAEKLGALLSAQEERGQLPRTILYALNPSANYALASIAGCFQNAEVPGRVQFGSGWWFADQKAGMIDQLTALSSVGLLGNFVGMLTDSRSFVSYPRHEYFRRILCNLVGGWVENGEYPYDMDALREIIGGICYGNAVKYFKML